MKKFWWACMLWAWWFRSVPSYVIYKFAGDPRVINWAGKEHDRCLDKMKEYEDRIDG